MRSQNDLTRCWLCEVIGTTEGVLSVYIVKIENLLVIAFAFVLQSFGVCECKCIRCVCLSACLPVYVWCGVCMCVNFENTYSNTNPYHLWLMFAQYLCLLWDWCQFQQIEFSFFCFVLFLFGFRFLFCFFVR